MKGADEYCELFDHNEQHGQLYMVPGRHARGATFCIFVLPEGEVGEGYKGNPPTNDGAVEVYGIVGGNPGWTEEYGWLHNGKWQSDFAILCTERRFCMLDAKCRRDVGTKERQAQKTARDKALLGDYK